MTTFIWVLTYLMIAGVVLVTIATWNRYEDRGEKTYAMVATVFLCAGLYAFAKLTIWLIKFIGGLL